MNWWVSEISDSIHWDTEGLAIIDPKQFQHIVDLIEPLYDYGFLNEFLDKAFYTFIIEKIYKETDVLIQLISGTEEAEIISSTNIFVRLIATQVLMSMTL